tara:strand:+ start:445 stop:582 length:138 start_codon:yes stop_codon:yes gene_type:complete
MIAKLMLITMLSIEEPKFVIEEPKVEARRRGKQNKNRRRGGNGLR